ncbi:putative membrane protein [Crocosphaera subtropica ATCC 51142]|uniref:Membrane protein n=1 Tax=Crocosphaera subtropica (strain ATCC 51142 / BH68) TaxID=43989 RepID=B1WZY1_CROS5|nr:DUF2062 domain-containing protein [Crocosphaera subtropica]ACB52880.1 putative membrane protein [Crocosphaera subtropica ATCC 51142]
MSLDPSPLPVIFQDKKPQHRRQSKRRRSKIKRSWRYFYLRFLRLRGTPRYISRGLAFGVLAGCFPLFGLQTIMGVLLAVLFRGHKLAAAAGTWISNPLTYVPIFAFNYKVGELLLGFGIGKTQVTFPDNWQSWAELKASGLVFLVTLFFGCLVVGLIASILTYFLSVRFLSRWRRRG